MVEILQLAVLVVSVAVSLVLKRPVKCEVVEPVVVSVSTETVKARVTYEASKQDGKGCLASAFSEDVGCSSEER